MSNINDHINSLEVSHLLPTRPWSRHSISSTLMSRFSLSSDRHEVVDAPLPPNPPFPPMLHFFVCVLCDNKFYETEGKIDVIRMNFLATPPPLPFSFFPCCPANPLPLFRDIITTPHTDLSTSLLLFLSKTQYFLPSGLPPSSSCVKHS